MMELWSKKYWHPAKIKILQGDRPHLLHGGHSKAVGYATGDYHRTSIAANSSLAGSVELSTTLSGQNRRAFVPAQVPPPPEEGPSISLQCEQ